LKIQFGKSRGIKDKLWGLIPEKMKFPRVGHLKPTVQAIRDY
jgi:hypothetical protein